MSRPEVQVFESDEVVARSAARRLVVLARKAIAEHGCFHVALAGGSTPRRLYQYLAEPAISSQVDWRHVHVYFGDERCVAPDNVESNYHMVSEALLRHVVELPDTNVHRIQGESSSPELAAREYATLLSRQLRNSSSGFPVFDLILLGMGDDGHTASLFPETDILNVRDRSVAAVFVPDKGVWRISLTLSTINHAAHVLFLVCGEAKAARLRQVLYPEPGQPLFPAQRVAPVLGEVSWYLDTASASQLPRETV